MKINIARIEIFMAKKELSAKALAEQAAMSQQNLSTIKLRGTCRPETAGKLAMALGVSVEEIIQEGAS